MLGANFTFCLMACLVKITTGYSAWMTTPVLNSIAGLLLFHEPMTIRSGIGAPVILGSSAGLLLEKG